MEIIEDLILFGLTRQEANIYIFLLCEGEASGYEVSKKTGISKSNTYTSLAALVEKGAAYIIEGNAVLYTPVNIEEFCNNKIKALVNKKINLINNMPKKRKECNGYITIKGEEHILDKLSNMLIEANERVYLSMCHEMIEKFEAELDMLKQRGIKLVIITDGNLMLDGAKVYYEKRNKDQVRLIVDSKNVLTGEVGDKLNSTCLYSSNNNLVTVFKDALANEIRLIEIKEG